MKNDAALSIPEDYQQYKNRKVKMAKELEQLKEDMSNKSRKQFKYDLADALLEYYKEIKKKINNEKM